MERFRCRAVVLSTLDYGESDRVVTLLTDARGRVAAFARGARASRRRFAGVLEPFTLLRADLVATRGSTLRLDAAEALDGFGPLREDLARVARASYAAELLRELCREHEPHPELFELLCRFLGALAREDAGPGELLHFELGALAGAGLMPRLDRCARCGSDGIAEPHFDPEQGGLLCPRCAGGRGGRISLETARALGALQRARRAADVELTVRVRAEARGILTRYVAHHLGRRPRSLDFMRELGVEV